MIICLLISYFEYVVIDSQDFFFRASFTSLHTHASIIFFLSFFVLFHSFCYIFIYTRHDTRTIEFTLEWNT